MGETATLLCFRIDQNITADRIHQTNALLTNLPSPEKGTFDQVTQTSILAITGHYASNRLSHNGFADETRG